MGWYAVAAGIGLLAAAGLLLTFFVTGNEAADAISNWVFLIFYVLMAWTMVGLHRLYATRLPVVWVLTLVGLVAVVAFGGILVWMTGVSILVLVDGGLPTALAWLGVGVAVVTAVTLGAFAADRELLRGTRRPGPVLNAVSGVILLGLAGWIVWLGLAPTAT